MLNKKTAFFTIVLCVAMFFSACKKAEEPPLYIEVAAYRVFEEDVNEFAKHMKSVFPEYAEMNVSGSSLDDPGIGFQIVVFMFASEIELFICDASISSKLAAQGENFIPLAQMFTQEELQSFNGKGVTFAKEDDLGGLTGEYSEICGLDLTDSQKVVELTKLPNPQIFIVASTKNMEAAKATFKYLATI